MFDMMGMMGKMKEVQAKLKEAQENLQHITVSAEAGAGLVKATVNGQRKLLKIEIDESILNVNDREMVNDLVVAAVNKGSLERIITVKYSPAGEELWVAYYSSPFQANATGIAVDKNGDVYVIGSDDAYTTSRGSALILKYNGDDGTRLWQKRHNPVQASRGLRILLDDQGNVFVVGQTTLAFNIFFLSKLDPADGSLEWNRLLTGTGNEEDYPNNLLHFNDYALDDAGDVYVTGGIGYPLPEQDLIVVKYSGTDGQTVWKKSYASGEADEGLEIIVDKEAAYVAGRSSKLVAPSPVNTAFIIKYDIINGEELWFKPIVHDLIPITNIQDLSIIDDAIYFTGLREIYRSSTLYYLMSYSTSGGELTWLVPYIDSIAEIAPDNAGNLYVAGNSANSDYVIRKFNALTGSLEWEHPYSGDGTWDNSLELAVLDNGDAILAGINSSDKNFFIARHRAASGAQLWKSFFTGFIHTDDKPVSIKTDAEGNSFLAGTSIGSILSSGSDNIIGSYSFIIKYSPKGEEFWQILEDNITSTHIAVDNAGNVYMLGSRRGNDGRINLHVIKYNGDNGTKLWTYEITNGNNIGFDIKNDEQGDVFVSGSRSHPAIQRGIQHYLYKLNTADGTLRWAQSFSDLTSPSTSELSNLRDFEIDAMGDVYVAGSSETASATRDVALFKLSGQTGDRIWTKHYDSGHSDIVLGLEVSNNKEVFITGTSIPEQEEATTFLAKYDAITGEQIGLTERGGFHLSLDNAGGAYIQSGRSILKFNTNDLSLIWETILDFVPDNFEVDVAGNVYTTNFLTGSTTTTKYAGTSGAKVWEITADTLSNAILYTLDDNLDIFVTGTTFSESTGDDILTIKYSQQGTDLLCFDPLQVQLSLPPNAAHVGEQVRTTADFGDYVPGEAHNIRWMWGDQSQPTIAYFARGDSHVTGEHTYSQASIYKVGLDFNESCLIAADETYKEWLVIYDPNAGSVTGGGQLLSLQTSLPWMSQQLNAQFSFNVRYNQNKDTTPQGQTQLNLWEQGVFRSNSIEWLVVRGDQALWQGTGTLNGQGNYGFTASVWDGRGTGADDAGDELRIRIWNKNAGNAIVYDNFETAGDIYDMTNPTSRITRGQIIIHPFTTASKTASQQAELYNYPNTFKDKTTITFTADKEDAYRLEVYDMRGKLVKQLWQGEAEEGQRFNVELDGTSLPKGIYVTRLVSSTGTQSIKMLLER